MAKALLGHLGGSGPHDTDVIRLRRRISDLEALVLRLQAENDRLAAAVHHEKLLTLDDDRESILA